MIRGGQYDPNLVSEYATFYFPVTIYHNSYLFMYLLLNLNLK